MGIRILKENKVKREWERTVYTNFKNCNNIRIFLLPPSMRAMYAHVCKPRDKEKIRFSTLLEYRSVSVYLVIQELSTWIHILLFFYFMTDLKFCVLARHSVVNQSTPFVVFSQIYCVSTIDNYNKI